MNVYRVSFPQLQQICLFGIDAAVSLATAATIVVDWSGVDAFVDLASCCWCFYIVGSIEPMKQPDTRKLRQEKVLCCTQSKRQNTWYPMSVAVKSSSCRNICVQLHVPRLSCSSVTRTICSSIIHTHIVSYIHPKRGKRQFRLNVQAEIGNDFFSLVQRHVTLISAVKRHSF